ncbi:HAD family hydrolase [Novosphingobium olei]|uniref:HAD family hydrolase n=1 Tax=Novosphingobium olei TaxID=2728851 RepID=A0A7Y0BRU1_9SPHN|nr:HAD family hydrolase [Novosphingobium olei]NML95442.1 HAD family hydrolase [Novosphingobium olei]BEU99053.1 HAD family hydrolase [Novosphingobium olei]
MNRPLVISDCDEVLLHMVAPYRDFLAEQHDIDFVMNSADFGKAMRYRDGRLVEPAEIWRLLNLFFDTEMHRQQAIAGAVEGINALAQHADVVILTNLNDHRRDTRAEQLRNVGIDARVFTNQGPKGPALKAILEEYNPSKALFIDDLPQHHGSVAEMLPHVTRLHLCGEPMIAAHIDCAHKAGHAHARIDDWATALPWIMERISGDNDD